MHDFLELLVASAIYLHVILVYSVASFNLVLVLRLYDLVWLSHFGEGSAALPETKLNC